ncbi:MAG: hypothetical protein HEQ32_05970 [Vampirovibrio sp.]
MSYSEDLIKCVVEYVKEGGSKSNASRLYKVSRPTLYRWLNAPSLKAKKPGPKARRSIHLIDLQNLIDAEPDLYLAEMAECFNTSYSTVWRGCRDLEITRKKTTRYQERN